MSAARWIGAAGALAAALAVVGDPAGAADEPADVPAVAAVQRGTLSSQIDSTGTLGYAARADGSPYEIVNQAGGAYTWLPSAGAEIRCGEPLYRVADRPVVLLCGSVPAYRALSEGASGPDVRQLNDNLVQLGYATREQLDPDSDEFTAATAEALRELQDELDVDETGELRLGQAVFLPRALRIGRVSATLGAPARPGGPVGQASSTRRRVEVDLDAAQAGGVRAGDRVQVTLPDNRVAAGVVERVGAVATQAKEDAPATIPVSIRLRRAADAGRIDEAPVRVQITTSRVEDALSVPVTALVAASGGYAVETAERRLVPVRLGMFDHAGGRVQVTGSGLRAGQRVVVPSP